MLPSATTNSQGKNKVLLPRPGETSNASYFGNQLLIPLKTEEDPQFAGSPMKNQAIVVTLKNDVKSETTAAFNLSKVEQRAAQYQLQRESATQADIGDQPSRTESHYLIIQSTKVKELKEVDGGPLNQKRAEKMPLSAGASKLRFQKEGLSSAHWQLPDGNLEIQGARFGNQQTTQSALSSMQPAQPALHPLSPQQDQGLFQRIEEQKIADILHTHDLREARKQGLGGQDKRHVYLRDIDPLIELKPSHALAPLAKHYRTQKHQPLTPKEGHDLEESGQDKERINRSTKLSPIASTHYEDGSKKKKTTATDLIESRRESLRNVTHYNKSWMRKNALATQQLSHGAFSVRESSHFADQKLSILHKKNRMSMHGPSMRGVPAPNKFVLLPSQRGSRRQDAAVVEGVNARQLVSQQVDRCKLLGKSQIRSRPRGGIRGAEGVEEIIKKRHLLSPQTDKLFGKQSLRDSDQLRESVQEGQMKELRESSMSPHFQAPSERISSMDQNLQQHNYSQFDKFQDLQKVNDDIFKMNMLKKFPNAEVTKNFFKGRQAEAKNAKLGTTTSAAQGHHTARATLSVRGEEHSGSQEKAIQIIGAKEGQAQEGLDGNASVSEPYYLNLIKLKNAKEREEYSRRFRSQRQGDSEGQTTEPEDSLQVGLLNQSLFNSLASKESVQHNLTPIEENQYSCGLVQESVDSLQQMSKITVAQEKRMIQAFMQIEEWNMRRDEEVQALINITGANVNDQKQNVLDYFTKRNHEVENMLKAHFGRRFLERKFGVPRTIESLLHLIIDTLLNDIKKLMTFFTQEKIALEFTARVGQQRLQDLIQMVEQYKKKEVEEKEFGRSLERIDGLKALIEEYESIDQLDLEKLELDDDMASGCKNVLELAYQDLNRQRGDIRTGNELDVQALPYDKIEILMSKKTSWIQKRTAFKVLKRHFRKDPEVEDAETQVNFYEHLLGDMEKFQEYIDQLKEKIRDMEEQQKKLRAQNDDFLNKMKQKNQEIDSLKHELLLARQTLGENKVEIVELTKKVEVFKEVIVEKETFIQVQAAEHEKCTEAKEEKMELVNDLEEKIKDYEKEIELLKQQMQSLEAAIAKYKENAGEMRDKISALESEISGLRSQNKELQQELADQQKKAAQLQKQLDKKKEDASKKKEVAAPVAPVEIKVPVEVPRPLVKLKQQNVDLAHLSIKATIKEAVVVEVKKQLTGKEPAKPSKPAKETPKKKQEKKVEKSMQKDKSEPRLPQKSKNASISVHTQTKPIESKKKSVASTQTIEVQASSSVTSKFEKKEENAEVHSQSVVQSVAQSQSIDQKDQSEQKGQSIVSEQRQQMQIEENFSEKMEEKTSEKVLENKEQQTDDHEGKKSVASITVQTQTDKTYFRKKEEKLRKIKNPQQVVVTASPAKPSPTPPERPATVERATSPLNIQMTPDENVQESKQSSAFGLQRADSREQGKLLKDYSGEKNPMTNIEVQRKVIKYQDQAVQVDLTTDAIRFEEQFTVMPLPEHRSSSPQGAQSPPKVESQPRLRIPPSKKMRQKNTDGPPIYGFAYNQMKAGESLMAGSSDGSQPPQIYRREDGSLTRALPVPQIINDHRAVKKGKLIKGKTRGLRNNRDNSLTDEPLMIDLQNKGPQQSHRSRSNQYSPPKRGSTSSPNHKKNFDLKQYSNQIFDLSRVILNSRALNNDSGVVLTRSNKGSSYKGHGESIPDDSLFNPSQDPIKVREPNTKKAIDFILDSQQHSTAVQSTGKLRVPNMPSQTFKEAVGASRKKKTTQRPVRDSPSTRHDPSLKD